MVVDGENVVGVARHVDKTETIPKNRGDHSVVDHKVVAAHVTHLLPFVTLITDRGAAGPPEKRPRPLIKVVSAMLE